MYKNKLNTTDWFVDYEQLKPLFRTHLSQQTPTLVLDVGCGTSQLGPRLSQDFPHTSVYCMDVSTDCLLHLSQQYDETLTSCSFVVGDVRRKLPFDDACVDYVIDKGTYDAVHRHKEGSSNCTAMLSEIGRVLKPGCVYLQISGESPDEQLDVLRANFPGDQISYQLLKDDEAAEVYAYKVTKSTVS